MPLALPRPLWCQWCRQGNWLLRSRQWAGTCAFAANGDGVPAPGPPHNTLLTPGVPDSAWGGSSSTCLSWCQLPWGWARGSGASGKVSLLRHSEGHVSRTGT